MFIYIACNYNHYVPYYPMYHLHNHSYICIITGSWEEQLAVEPDVVEEFQPEEPA
jgi:hypothetical protein